MPNANRTAQGKREEPLRACIRRGARAVQLVLDTIPPPLVNAAHPLDGAVAQLGERVVRNDEVRGSIPLGSTNGFQTIYSLSDLTACMALMRCRAA